jgi:hypothetical protein
MGMLMEASITVAFLDSKQKSQRKADPLWPKGKPLNLAEGVTLVNTCTRNLPHPAPRAGVYWVECKTCGFTGAFPVAGLADDPCMVTIPCRRTDQ